MFKHDEKLAEEKRLLELKELKRKNRRRNGVLLVAALQVTSLVIFYYLGRSHR